MKKSAAKIKSIENKLLVIRGQYVLLDSDIAAVYGVETREINQAVKNNQNKFPPGYFFKPTSEEQKSLRSKNLILGGKGRGQYSKYTPTIFTEKGLYMLATILKSPKATETTIAIVETFAKVRELNRTVAEMPIAKEKNRQKLLAQRSSEIISDLLAPSLPISESETSVEINLAIMKIKRTIKREKK